MYSDDVRNIATKLYTKLSSLRKVAFILDTSFSTVSRWVNFTKKDRKQIIKKLDPTDITDAIKLFVNSHPFCSLKDIQIMILKTFNLNVSTELIRLFINKHNYTKKRARYYSVPKDDEIKLITFINQRNKFVQENRKFISIDETSFGRNYLPAFGYSEKGKRLNIKKPVARVTTQSVLTSVSIGDPIQYCKKEGSFNTESFCAFLKTLNYPEKSVLIMDNVSFHHSKLVMEVIINKGWDVLYVAPYSPIFNPIEGVFSIVKRQYQKIMDIEKSFKCVTNEHIISFFRQSFNAVSRF